jgi:chemotaxis protein MotB
MRRVPGLAVAASALLGGACALPQTYESVLARSRALEFDQKALRDELGKLRSDLGERQREQMRLQESAESLQQEKVGLLEQAEDLRMSTEQLRELLERERLEREMKEQEIRALTGNYKTLIDSLEQEVRDGNIEVQRLKGRLQVTALEKILFDSGKAELKSEGRAVLERVAEQLAKIEGQRVRVEGHTDNVPIRNTAGRFPTNWELSAARATGVVRAFVDAGLDPRKLAAVGCGEFQPVESNESDEGRARNRRIEIILIPDGESEEG